MNKLAPFLWFNDNAEEAAEFYLTVFPHARKVDELRSKGVGPWPVGKIATITIELEGQEMVFLNGGPAQDAPLAVCSLGDASITEGEVAEALQMAVLKRLPIIYLVQDNGWGIPRENLARIFAHGFTTKPDGHGFGLHTSALAATEMGGSLSAHSDGMGMGATILNGAVIGAASNLARKRS